MRIVGGGIAQPQIHLLDRAERSGAPLSPRIQHWLAGSGRRGQRSGGSRFPRGELLHLHQLGAKGEHQACFPVAGMIAGVGELIDYKLIPGERPGDALCSLIAKAALVVKTAGGPAWSISG